MNEHKFWQFVLGATCSFQLKLLYWPQNIHVCSYYVTSSFTTLTLTKSAFKVFAMNRINEFA